MKRRNFLKTIAKFSIFTAAPVWGASQFLGANERVRLGVIGCGGRGRFVARQLAQAGGQIVALCDVYETQMRAANQELGGACRCFPDFRNLLAERDIDAVLVATPDHWHAIPTIMGCQAGKDVYVEKPLGHNIREGQAMVREARRSRRIVQCWHSTPVRAAFSGGPADRAKRELGKSSFRAGLELHEFYGSASVGPEKWTETRRC